MGHVSKGLNALFLGINNEHVFVGSLAIGLGHYMLTRAVKYSNERSVWGCPIGKHQWVAHPLVDAMIQLETAALMVKKAALMTDAGLDAGDVANMAKYSAANAALACAEAAIACHGGNALALEYELIRYWPQIRVMRSTLIAAQMVLNY